MFSTGKNWILNILGILCIPQNFRPRKGPEYLYQLFDVFPKQATCEMKALQVYKFTFNNDFMMNRELILLWPEIFQECTYLLVGGLIFKSKLLRSSGRFWISCWKLFLSLPAAAESWHISWRCIAHDVLPYWDILARKENLKNW